LSEGGERLYSTVRPAIEEGGSAVIAVGELGDAPRGNLRLLVNIAASAGKREGKANSP